ncbi:flotillin family protein [Nocardia sp. SYP-A9097]|uniref:SPFH domain-containing protein n=1 Tax=Nocardia sp. SYP-A9097 TaxID=2663237 RepID=UPI0013236091|nr:SPFH domain-containing protein [Nocardia sp. SYP-A9097]MRH91754.1 flotillin family protein [Nocardia sp. SYP-A9097]
MDVLVLVSVGIALIVLVLLVGVFRAAWRIAEPDEALIISGFRAGTGPGGSGESMGFRIVTGRGCLIMPGLTKVRRISLEAHESQIVVPCVSRQKINLALTGVVMYKVGDDYGSIANAARRFLDRPADELETKVQNVFIGHLRAIAGSMTVEDMISDQDKFSEQVRDRCSHEMESFGLVIDSFQIQSIASESNYIANLAIPRHAEVEQHARIARANAERAAIEQEQSAQAQVALAVRDTQIKKAGYQAEVDRATQESQQQGPLAEATARQAVVEVATKVAQLEAQQREQELQASIRKPADAEAYRQTTLATAARDVQISQAQADAQETRLRAEAAAAQTKMQAQAEAESIKVRAAAQAEATRLTGQAEADAIQARGLAEAETVRARMAAEAAGIQQRAEAMSKNQEAVIAQQVAQNLPEIVAAAAKPFEHIGQFTVLNGAQGVTSALAEIIQQAGTLTAMARESLLPALKVEPAAVNGEVKPSA